MNPDATKSDSVPTWLSVWTILVTGGAGFLGSRLVEALKQRGANNIVVPRSSEHDLRNGAATARLFAGTNPDVVFHLAAQVGGIGANRDNPGSFFYDNMAMGINVLEQARLHKTAKVIVVGTVCAYPKHCQVPFREDDLWNGYPEETNAPYGIAKKALLVMAQSYRQQYGSNFVMVFPVNLYGPGDNFDLHTSHVIPAMIRKFSEAKERGNRLVTLWGTGEPTREFLYVDDCVDGLILAAERYNGVEPVNLGSGFEISIIDLAKKIRAATGYSGDIVWDTDKPSGQLRRSLDVSRAKSFGFESRTSLDEGLAKTVAWYHEHLTSSPP